MRFQITVADFRKSTREMLDMVDDGVEMVITRYNKAYKVIPTTDAFINPDNTQEHRLRKLIDNPPRTITEITDPLSVYEKSQDDVYKLAHPHAKYSDPSIDKEADWGA